MFRFRKRCASLFWALLLVVSLCRSAQTSGEIAAKQAAAAAHAAMVAGTTSAPIGRVTHIHTDPRGTPLTEADATGAITPKQRSRKRLGFSTFPQVFGASFNRDALRS
jgi:hypothetical protein